MLKDGAPAKPLCRLVIDLLWMTEVARDMTEEKRVTPELCLERSAECQRLSKVVIRPEHQVALLNIAETWARLARESMPQESHQ